MAKLILLLLFLLVLFGYGPRDLPQFPPDRGEEWRTEGALGGNASYTVTERGRRDIYVEFRGPITGNASVNLKAEDGDIFVMFGGRIAGNPSVSIETTGRGNIHVLFDDEIAGAARVRIASGGDVIFLNDEDTIAGYQSRNQLSVSAGGRIRYNRRPGLFILHGDLRPRGVAAPPCGPRGV